MTAPEAGPAEPGEAEPGEAEPGEAEPGEAEPGSAARISVVICAYLDVRWDDTLAAVSSVQRQSLPPCETIVVVDHNPALCQRFGRALPGVAVVASRGEPGLSGAKNTGIETAAGDIIAFLDDDAVAEPDWLKFLADSYSGPAVAGVGGRTLPRWQTSRPAWLPGEFDWVLGCSYVGMPEGTAPVRNVMGGNASFRREVFSAVGGFRSGIGRSGDSLPFGCEETEFCIRLGQQVPGWSLLLDSRAVIWHWVPAARCRLSYFVRRCYAEGVSKALVSDAVGAADGLSAERRHVRSALPRGVARYLAQACGGDPAGLGRAGATVVGLAAAGSGYAAGWLRGQRDARHRAGR